MSIEVYIRKYFRFKPKLKQEFLQQYALYQNALNEPVYAKTAYQVGDDVQLEKGHFLHGMYGEFSMEKLLKVKEQGLLSNDFVYGKNKSKQKNPYLLNLWNIQHACTLAEYINTYSGAVLVVQQQNGKKDVQLIQKSQMPTLLENLNKRDFWIWKLEQTKEQRFLPVAGRDFTDVAFVIQSKDARVQEMVKKDVFSYTYPQSLIKQVAPAFFYKNFLCAPRDALTTDRESAIFLGLPPCSIEGIFISERVEKNKKQIEFLKQTFPWSYICNTQGKVI